MSNTNNSFSFCKFIGKLVLKLSAIAAVIVAANLVLAKVFKKKLSVSVDVTDIEPKEEDADSAEDGEEAPEEPAEETEE